MESRNSSSDNEGEYNDRDFMDHFDLEADKNRIVEHSPKGRFIRFNEELGSGAYKTVYKGYDNETGCEIAWNVIKLPKLPPKERKRISDEIALLKKLKHPNIISFISAWINKQKEEIVFITEVVTGGSLKKYLKKIKSPRLKVIKSWCREILQGIEYLHELKPHPIIHRDIKCDNIFINSNKGEIRIGDLGLATLMSNAYAASVLGTPEFMAPEMYDEVYGPSVDIYSFGMCLLEMVTNQTPYRECMNPAQVYKKVINGVKPASLGLIANEEVKGFICECLLPRDERPSATNLLNNRFLQSADQEADNQPVALFETPLENIKEDEHSYTMKTEITMPQQFDEELGDENDEAEHEKETSPTNVETNAEISESINQREELKNTELQKRKSSDCVNHNEKKHELFIASAAAGKFKSFDQISTILNNQKIGEKEFVEDIKNDAVQEKAELSFQQKQTPLPSARKDQIKYSLQSKGIINGQLVILIKGDMQGHQFEHTAEIRRDKISYEKVISKLQKQLSFLPITNDADFRNQVKTLLESIDYLNISTFMNSGLPPLNSATSIQIKSPSNGNFEFHSNHEKSSNNIFQSQLFLAFYDNYMSHLMKDNLWNETEEAMALRQQGELLELQNRHLLQKRTLWDKKHNVLSNSTIAIQSQTIETEDAHHRLNQIYDSHFKHSEARIKELGQNNFFFSPLSSGPLSPTTSGDNLGSANISVEIMASLLKKLGNTVDDHNKSTSHHPDNFSENVQRSNLASPNNQDILSKAAIEKGGSVFKFPAQLSTGANSHVSHNTVPQKNTNELINKLSPKNHIVYSSVTSPKDVAPIIGSPKGYKIVSQDNKVTPMKSVSDKEELHQRRFENPFNNNNEQKEEEKTAKIHANKTVDTIQAKKQQDLPNKELIAAEAVDAKKENRYGSLTINTDIANQAEKTQTPSQTQGPQGVKTRTEEAPKQEVIAVEVKVPQKTISDTHLDKQDDSMPLMKKTSSTPKPATTVPPCSNAQPKQSSFRDQASSQHVNNLTAHSSVTRNSPVNAARPEKRYFTQQVVNNGGNATTQALYSPQQSYSTPKASVGNCQKFCFALGKGQNEVSGPCEAKNCLYKGQPTYDLLKKIKGYKMAHTIGKNVTEANCEDIRVLQSCLELLTGQEISSNGQYTPYIESQVKIYQEKAGLAVDGIVTPNLWEKMLSSLEKMEKKWMTKEYMKQKEIDDLMKDREDLKKKLKDKQNKEASESLTKIESKLVDLSSLM